MLLDVRLVQREGNFLDVVVQNEAVASTCGDQLNLRGPKLSLKMGEIQYTPSLLFSFGVKTDQNRKVIIGAYTIRRFP